MVLCSLPLNPSVQLLKHFLIGTVNVLSCVFNLRATIQQMRATECISYHITCYLADAFIQSDLQFRLSKKQSPLEQCGVKGLAQGPNSCADFIVATPGITPPGPSHVPYPQCYRPPLNLMNGWVY